MTTQTELVERLQGAEIEAAAARGQREVAGSELRKLNAALADVENRAAGWRYSSAGHASRRLAEAEAEAEAIRLKIEMAQERMAEVLSRLDAARAIRSAAVIGQETEAYQACYEAAAVEVERLARELAALGTRMEEARERREIARIALDEAKGAVFRMLSDCEVATALIARCDAESDFEGAEMLVRNLEGRAAALQDDLGKARRVAEQHRRRFWLAYREFLIGGLAESRAQLSRVYNAGLAAGRSDSWARAMADLLPDPAAAERESGLQRMAAEAGVPVRPNAT